MAQYLLQIKLLIQTLIENMEKRKSDKKQLQCIHKQVLSLLCG